MVITVETLKGTENQESTGLLSRPITRRQAIMAGGIAVVGLAFSKPLIQTVMPKPAFANYVPTTTGRGCTPGFWGGGKGKTLWNEVNDPQWFSNGGGGGVTPNPFIHTTPFCDVFYDEGACSTYSMIDMLEILPPPIDAPKGTTAMHVVAAYLNADFFGAAYPYTRAEVKVMWEDACKDGSDSAFESLLRKLDLANNAGCLD
jgi:hypothetical protein